jgi:hypothetical protein
MVNLFLYSREQQQATEQQAMEQQATDEEECEWNQGIRA